MFGFLGDGFFICFVSEVFLVCFNEEFLLCGCFGDGGGAPGVAECGGEPHGADEAPESGADGVGFYFDEFACCFDGGFENVDAERGESCPEEAVVDAADEASGAFFCFFAPVFVSGESMFKASVFVAGVRVAIFERFIDSFVRIKMVGACKPALYGVNSVAYCL